MRVLVLRPERDAEALAATLAALGHEAVVAPLMEIEPGATPPDLKDADALLITSRNAVRAIAGFSAFGRGLPVYAVGGKTAEAARAAGFAVALTGAGTMDSLLTLIEDLAAADRPRHVAYLSGDIIRQDPAARLAALGVKLDRHVVYRAKPVDALPPAAAGALKARRLDWALFYSPRSADLFLRYVEAAGLSANIAGLRAGCLSPAVAKVLDGQAFREVAIAAEPSQTALLAACGMASEHEAQDHEGQKVSEQPDIIEGEAETAAPRNPKQKAAAPKLRETPRKKNRLSLIPWLIILLLLIFGAGIYVSPWLAARVGAYTPWLFASPGTAAAPEDRALEALGQRLAALDQALSRQQSRFDELAGQSAAAGPTADLGPVHERLDALAAQVADIELQAGGDAGAGSAAAAQISGLQQRLTDVEAQTQQLLSQADETPAVDPAKLAALEGQVAHLQQAVGANGASAETVAALRQEVESLRGRLDAVANAETSQTQSAMSVMAVRQLGRALQSGRPYAADLAELKTLLKAGGRAGAYQAQFASLAAAAEEGLATRQQLETEFAAASKDWLTAANTPPDAGWLARLWIRIKSLVTVRKVGGDVEGETPAAIISRAEAALEDGDLESAIEEVAALPGEAGEDTQIWLDEARARLAAERALESLEGALALAPGGPGD